MASAWLTVKPLSEFLTREFFNIEAVWECVFEEFLSFRPVNPKQLF